MAIIKGDFSPAGITRWVGISARNFDISGAALVKAFYHSKPGDTVVACVEHMGHLWRGKRVPIGVDNKAFECSGEKGRSKAPRLNILIRELFYLQLRFECVLDFFWLSSLDNLLADHLSRDRESSFLHDAYATGFWDSAVSPLRHASSGETRTLPDRTMFA